MMRRNWHIVVVLITALVVMSAAWAKPSVFAPVKAKYDVASSASLSYDSQTCTTRAAKLEPLKLVALQGSAYYEFLRANQGPWYRRWANSFVSVLKRLNPFK